MPETQKSVRRSVALAISRGAASRNEVLTVLRPPDDADLPDTWGLPAASLRAGETWPDAARRAARDKLGVGIAVGDLLNEGQLERPGYTLQMRLYSAEITVGEPVVPQPARGVTQYRAWRWGVREDLMPAVRAGSLCCRLFVREW